VRRALGALLLALGRDPGATLIETDRWTLAEELSSFGEDSLSPAALQLSDEDMVRLWLLAGDLLLKERARSSGEATALAAVEVIEGNQRPLAPQTEAAASQPSPFRADAGRTLRRDLTDRGQPELR
jgi:hypothetical protein